MHADSRRLVFAGLLAAVVIAVTGGMLLWRRGTVPGGALLLGAAALLALAGAAAALLPPSRRRPMPRGPSPFAPHGPSAFAPTEMASESSFGDTVSALPTLGAYRVESELEHGAMGAVYLARDPTTGQPLALKTLALGSEFEGEALVEARERFQREAETAKRLKHPDIVAVIDSGETRQLAWIAMEHVPGRDLGHYTRPPNLLPLPVLLRIGARIALALAHAHAQGVVHRDVKPANVMYDAESDTVKVMDFGIARIVDAARTRTGIVLGTPSYMSPEQMAGGRVDGRSDVYALGVTLFQLLTGRLPFEAESMGVLMAAIAQQPAPDVRSYRPELPAALADVITLALEKRPEVRYADARQIAEDLRAVEAMLQSVGVNSAAVPTPDRDGSFDDPGHNSR